jgi:hypothetical protein
MPKDTVARTRTPASETQVCDARWLNSNETPLGTYGPYLCLRNGQENRWSGIEETSDPWSRNQEIQSSWFFNPCEGCFNHKNARNSCSLLPVIFSWVPPNESEYDGNTSKL